MVIVGVIYLLFFLSGSAALMYQVAWVRSLSLVFGGSHLAVTTVLAVFMAGLALGSYILGKYVDRVRNPLALYGKLELGIALFAVLFIVLMKIYPSIYVPLAQGRDGSPLYLSIVRVVFAFSALIIPTTLMGGTLPVLSRFVSRRPDRFGTHLSLLYGFNTLGAVAGTAAAGFYFLRFYSLSTTVTVAVVMNVVIGVLSILLQKKASEAEALFAEGDASSAFVAAKDAPADSGSETQRPLPASLVLWGIGVSGFCALGYEVLWTKVLTIVVGASVYSFTTMLIAFLAGIALGSKAYGLFLKIFGVKDRGGPGTLRGFGIVQALIGLSALAVTIAIRNLPLHSLRLKAFFHDTMGDLFGAWQWANLTIALLYMLLPAFLMGLSFPLAGEVYAKHRKAVGSAVGRVLAFNTVGALLGAAASGFVFIYLFGIERSLQMLTIVNIGMGLMVVASLGRSAALRWAPPAAALALIAVLATDPAALRVWDTKYFAVFRANQPEAFKTPELIKEALDNTDVLYYAEGVEAIVSSIKVKGGDQAFLTNGRVEASSRLEGQQTQYTLGHLPMLLNRNPRRVLVVALGSGMTLGATSAHPSVEQVTLAEIEPKVLGVARTFERYNHRILDNPKLRIVFNDGRNFLLTTKEKFDVITADPIHPWFRGAGYLYTAEYFKLAAERLSEGGVMCQWLPIYELTAANLKSVARTFNEHFRYTMMWLNHNDAVLVGSNAPFVLDEAELARRLSVPAIAEDLSRVMMGSARDFLSYFVMGTRGMRAFGQGGILNTDDNLYLEFSAPLSIGKASLMGENVTEIVRYREDILPYLAQPAEAKAADEQRAAWEHYGRAAAVYDRAHALFLWQRYNTSEFKLLIDTLARQYPDYAPGRFLRNEYLTDSGREPRLLAAKAFVFLDGAGRQVKKVISLVLAPVSEELTAVAVVDNEAKILFGQAFFSGPRKDEAAQRFAAALGTALQDTYDREAEKASGLKGQGAPVPPLDPAMSRLSTVISSLIQSHTSATGSQPPQAPVRK